MRASARAISVTGVVRLVFSPKRKFSRNWSIFRYMRRAVTVRSPAGARAASTLNDCSPSRGPGPARAARALERVLGGVREPGEQGTAIANADHLPEVVAVDQVAVLVDRLRLEHEGAGLDAMVVVSAPRGEDDTARLVGDRELHPGLDDVQRAGGKVVPHFVGRDDRPHRERNARRGLLRREQLEGDRRALRPLGGDLRDLDLAPKPLHDELGLLLSAGQLQHDRYRLVRPEEAVAAVLPVVVASVVVLGVSRGRVVGGDEGHVALAALDGLRGLSRVVPAAVLPVVVLVLELNPADLVHLLVDELLVAGGAVLGRLEQTLGEIRNVLAGVGADEEVPRQSSRPPLAQLEEIARRRRHDEVGVALHVGLADGMAREAGDAFLVADEVGQLRREDVLGPREERDRVVTAPAVPGRLGAVLLGHLFLDALEGRIHGRPAVGAHAPLLRDLLVTPRGPAGRGAREGF